MNRIICIIICIAIVSSMNAQTPVKNLETYRHNLNTLRQQHKNVRVLPDVSFFFFGMGDRKKLIYRDGKLMEAKTGAVIKEWIVTKEIIVPSEYMVSLETKKGIVKIFENEKGVYVLEKGKTTTISESVLKLPRFESHAFAPVLRVLHHEILININEGLPLPNFLVYKKPWFRDASIMGMVLKETNNLHLIKEWINSIRDPFDRNNHGISEADNPGEVLFLISLVANKEHPAVKMVLDSVKQFQKDNYIEGKTDYNEHPVFQTKWIKYGLKSLGLPDSYEIPQKYDSYSSLFWWDYKEQHVAGERFNKESSTNYPYLVWAEDNFYGEHNGIMGDRDYPLSWEAHASDATYSGMDALDKELAHQKISLTHTWHAAEMFLYLISAF